MLRGKARCQGQGDPLANAPDNGALCTSGGPLPQGLRFEPNHEERSDGDWCRRRALLPIMEVELWCWPYDRRVHVWCDFAGHVAIRINGNVYDFHPGPEAPTPSLQSDPVPGLVLIRSTRRVANDLAEDFDVCCQSLENRLMLDRSTGVFINQGSGHLPSLFAYRLDAIEAQVVALTSFFTRLESDPPQYHARTNNCINVARQALLHAGFKRFTGDDWEPGVRPGIWRPDEFNDFVAQQIDRRRQMQLSWDTGSQRKASEDHSYQWTEAPAST